MLRWSPLFVGKWSSWILVVDFSHFVFFAACPSAAHVAEFLPKGGLERQRHGGSSERTLYRCSMRCGTGNLTCLSQKRGMKVGLALDFGAFVLAFLSADLLFKVSRRFSTPARS